MMPAQLNDDAWLKTHGILAEFGRFVRGLFLVVVGFAIIFPAMVASMVYFLFPARVIEEQPASADFANLAKLLELVLHQTVFALGLLGDFLNAVSQVMT